MTDRIRIFDRSGMALLDVRADAYRLWSINDTGKAEFKIVGRNPAAPDSFTPNDNYYSAAYRVGNWVLIESDVLPPWVGIIDTPIQFTAYGVTINAKTADHWLYYRVGNPSQKLTGSAGDIFRQIILLAMQAEQTIIAVGEIYDEPGDKRTETLTRADLLAQVQALAERSGGEFGFRPQVSRGRLTVLADWYKRQGIDSGFVMEEGLHLARGASDYSFEDDVVNVFTAIGDEVNGSTRAEYTATDSDSIALYGVRQASDMFRGVTDPATLQKHADERLKTAKQPRKMFRLSVANAGAAFANCKLGNAVGVRLWSVGAGVDTQVRIVGMSYRPASGEVELIADEVIDG